MKAWIIEDYVGRCVVEFDDVCARARRTGAMRLEQGFDDVSIRRAKELDQYAPGPVSIANLMQHDWSFECSGCANQLYSDESPLIDEEAERVYCNEECKAKFNAIVAEYEKASSAVDSRIAPVVPSPEPVAP